ncbi:hypothetical protein [Kocuria aegyptia]|uniref:Uncharacterized protein n=1 Tax=Kocuria aegyptia TaxID=330943 RepID=A0ABP4W1W5_9MICC
MHDPQALAQAETYLLHVLEHSDPPRDASRYNVTAAARAYHDRTGNWDVRGGDPELVEQVLAEHPARD